MIPERTPLGHIEHAAGLFRRGIICEAEMWHQVARHLQAGRVEEVLAGLTEGAAAAFRARKFFAAK